MYFAEYVMASVEYAGPTGQLCSVPTEAFIDELFTFGDDYWLDPSGRGHGTFEYILDRNPASTLLISFKSGFGYYIMVREVDPKAHERYAAFDDSEMREDLAEIQYGGEPYFVPRPLFQLREQAMRAVKTFCQSGTRDPSINWRNWTDFEWDPSTGEWCRPK